MDQEPDSIFEYDPKSPYMVRFGDKLVEEAKVKEAVDYYPLPSPKGKKIWRDDDSMKAKFRFLKNEKHLRKLKTFHAKGDILLQIFYINLGEILKDRRNTIRFISNELRKQVFEKMAEGCILHDYHLKQFIAQIKKKNIIDIDFEGSHEWLNNFKRANKISSRHITKIVSKKNFRNKDELAKNAENFVKEFKKVIYF